MEKKYYKHKIENLLVITKLVTIHYLEFDKHFQSMSESHDFWELVYVEKGCLLCRAEQTEITLQEGEMLFHKPNELHSLRTDGKHAPNVVVITFECKSEAIHFFEGRKIRMNKALLPFLFAIIEESAHTFDIPPFDPFLKRMNFSKTPALGGQQLIKNNLEILLIRLMREQAEREKQDVVFLSKEQYEEHISKQVIAYMQRHITENLRIEDICTELHYNRSYIFKQFKKTTGSSIMAYFNRLKIEAAKRMLREDARPITEIAAALSFDNANYFSKCFKKHTGYTPSSYRKIRRGHK